MGKSTLSFCLISVLLLGAVAIAPPAEAQNNKVAICHIPPDNPANAHTITVNESAVPGHLAHGDSIGACVDYCDPHYVTRVGSVIQVKPHDYDRSSTYTWYDYWTLDEWILNGTPGEPDSLDFPAVLPAVTFDVLDQDGHPNIPRSALRVPNWFSRIYSAEHPDGLACAENNDCRTEAQQDSGLYGGYVCGGGGVCVIPNLGMVTRLFGFADRFDGDTAPGGADDLDPDYVADLVELTTAPQPTGAICQVDADCGNRLPNQPPLACEQNECVLESDAEMYANYLARYERRQAVQLALQDLVEVEFGFDATNLQCAFDAAGQAYSVELNHDPDEIYTVNETIHAQDFQQEFFGQGIDETRVEVAEGGVKNGPYPFFDVRPEIFIFERGDFTVRDFSVHVNGTIDWASHHLMHDLAGVFYVTGTHSLAPYDPDDANFVSARIHNVGFTGETGPQFKWGYNLLGPHIATGEQLIERDRFGGNLFTGITRTILGDHEVVGCTSESSLNGLAAFFGGPRDSSILLEGNDIIDSDQAFLFADVDGATATIRDNQVVEGGLVAILEGDMALFGIDLGPTGVYPTSPSTFYIEDNVTQTAFRWWANMELFSVMKFLPDGPRPSSTVHITDNVIEASNNFPGYFGAPYAFEGVFSRGFDYGSVTGNTFLCNPGVSGVYIGELGYWPDTGWSIADNTYDGCQVDIQLGFGTLSNSIEGDGATTVADQTCLTCELNEDCPAGATCSGGFCMADGAHMCANSLVDVDLVPWP